MSKLNYSGFGQMGTFSKLAAVSPIKYVQATFAPATQLGGEWGQRRVRLFVET